MKIIGLTGGIASGKSSVSKYIKELGVPVFDADEVARIALMPNSKYFDKVIDIFGEEILTIDKIIDRKKLADIVFLDKSKLDSLEKVVHEYVLEKLKEFLENNKNEEKVVLDVPLLIEVGWHDFADEVWVVSLPLQDQIKRAILRDSISKEKVEARIAAQLSLAEKSKYADKIIDNSGSFEETKKQIDLYLKEKK